MQALGGSLLSLFPFWNSGMIKNYLKNALQFMIEAVVKINAFKMEQTPFIDLIFYLNFPSKSKFLSIYH